mmetsp:Transcript_15241/g.28937  ORF Transcript_15241/g.28937 Transcript_15241/m.28937 type:complete len:199 (+) Transcript_15241:61-657(+)
MKLDALSIHEITRKRKNCTEYDYSVRAVPTKKMRTKRRVRFIEERNEAFRDEQQPRTLAECSASWYSSDEIGTFGHETNLLAANWIQTDQTAISLGLVFRAFLSASSKQEADSVIKSRDTRLTENNVGLEVFAIQSPRAKSLRRRYLLEQIFQFQNSHALTREQRENCIYVVARQGGRASCMYARYVAFVAAGLVQQN